MDYFPIMLRLQHRKKNTVFAYVGTLAEIRLLFEKRVDEYKIFSAFYISIILLSTTILSILPNPGLSQI